MDLNEKNQALKRLLTKVGPLTQKGACSQLGISQPVFSRLVRTIKDLLIIGKARATLYALKRDVPLVSQEIPIYEIDPGAKPHHLGSLFPIYPRSFFFESHSKDLPNQFFEDLPYFMDDLRPAGFLGRLIPKRHPEFGFPKEVNDWSSNHCLQYLTLFGWDLVGNLIAGERALELFLNHAGQKLKTHRRSLSKKEYSRLAKQILSFGEPGSSAGGEQPKFLAQRDSTTSVLVKFSPERSDLVSQRITDLLICEHIVHLVLRKFGQSTPNSRILKVGKQTFLENERFDRTAKRGRLGIISLKALDLQFVGSLKSWQESAASLLKQKLIDQEILQKIIWLDLFGLLIGNSDRHHGNISFYTEQFKPKELAPVYDMLPMRYAPHNQYLDSAPYHPPLSYPQNPALWESARLAAITFWKSVEKDRGVSFSFKKIARANRAYLSGGGKK